MLNRCVCNDKDNLTVKAESMISNYFSRNLETSDEILKFVHFLFFFFCLNKNSTHTNSIFENKIELRVKKELF